ncbi:MAG: helix-turn-helix transcriptional regulator, partial [Nitratireductor sp.]
RKAAGLLQKEVADKVGLSQPYFAQIERGERRLTTELQMKIADVLGVKPVDLVDFEAPSSRDEEELLQAFRSLPPERRREWLYTARAAAHPTFKEEE